MQPSGTPVGLFASDLEPQLFPQSRIEEMTGAHVHQRRERAGAKPGVLFLEVRQHAADDLALQVLLRAAQIARQMGNCFNAA